MPSQLSDGRALVLPNARARIRPCRPFQPWNGRFLISKSSPLPSPLRKARTAPRFGQRAGEGNGEIGFFAGPETGRDLDAFAARDKRQPQRPEFLMLLALKAHKRRIEAPFRPLALRAHFGDEEFKGCDPHVLIGARVAVIRFECNVEERDVEPDEAGDRPGAKENEGRLVKILAPRNTIISSRKFRRASERCGCSRAAKSSGS